HPPSLSFEDYVAEAKASSKNLSDLGLDTTLLLDVSETTVFSPRRSCQEIDVPDLKICVALPVEKGAANVLSEDTAVVRSRLRRIEVHLVLIHQKMLGNSALEVPLAMGTDTNYSGRAAAVRTDLALFIHEIDP